MCIRNIYRKILELINNFATFIFLWEVLGVTEADITAFIMTALGLEEVSIFVQTLESVLIQSVSSEALFFSPNHWLRKSDPKKKHLAINV